SDAQIHVLSIMIPRPPRSTLFPYTTPSDLKRMGTRTRDVFLKITLLPSVSANSGEGSTMVEINSRTAFDPTSIAAYFLVLINFRSEEHTSELQSRENLVCRLLLEKKKKKKI